MAIIASLALKVSADINGLLSGVKGTINAMDSIAKSAEKATPSIKNLEDSVQAIEILFEGLGNAKSKFDAINNSNSSIEEINKALDGYEKYRDTAEKVFDAVTRRTKASAEEIEKLPPTIENAEKAPVDGRKWENPLNRCDLSAKGRLPDVSLLTKIPLIYYIINN